MQQAKFSVEESQADFLSNYKRYGFKDKSSMVREALNRLREELELQSLRESADLFEDLQSSKSEALGKLKRSTRHFHSSQYFLYLRDREISTIPLRELRKRLSKIKVPLSHTIIEERRGR